MAQKIPLVWVLSSHKGSSAGAANSLPIEPCLKSNFQIIFYLNLDPAFTKRIPLAASFAKFGALSFGLFQGTSLNPTYL